MGATACPGTVPALLIAGGGVLQLLEVALDKRFVVKRRLSELRRGLEELRLVRVPGRRMRITTRQRLATQRRQAALRQSTPAHCDQNAADDQPCDCVGTQHPMRPPIGDALRPAPAGHSVLARACP